MSWTAEDEYNDRQEHSIEGIYIPDEFHGEITHTEYAYRRPFHHKDTGEVMSYQDERAVSLEAAQEAVKSHDESGWPGVKVVSREVRISVTDWSEN